MYDDVMTTPAPAPADATKLVTRVYYLPTKKAAQDFTTWEDFEDAPAAAEFSSRKGYATEQIRKKA